MLQLHDNGGDDCDSVCCGARAANEEWIGGLPSTHIAIIIKRMSVKTSRRATE